MSSKREKFRQAAMYYSAKERKTRLLSYDRDKYMHLESMSDLNLKLEYINVKAKYEHKKSILVLFLISIILAIFANIWRGFDSFLKQVLQFATNYQGNALEIVLVETVIVVSVIIAITFMILFLLVRYMKQMHDLYKYLLMIEEARKERENQGEK